MFARGLSTNPLLMEQWVKVNFFAHLKRRCCFGCICGGNLGFWSQWRPRVEIKKMRMVKEVADGENKHYRPQHHGDSNCKRKEALALLQMKVTMSLKLKLKF